MSSHRLRRAVSVVSSTLIVLTLLGPAGASAANTRSLYVGDPADYATPLPLDYFVHPTAVSPGNITYFDVLIKNAGGQTLTSAAIGMGKLIADNNGLTGPWLPTDWKIQNVTSQSGSVPTCATIPAAAAPTSGLITPGAYDGLNCNFGNLAKGSPGGTIRVFLTAGSALGTPQKPGSTDSATSIVVSGKVAEAVGGNVGSNSNTFYAYGAGSFFVSGPGKVAGLFTKSKISPSAHNVGQPNTSIDLTTVTGDYVVSIDETTAGPACPSIVTCIGGASTAHVNFGHAVSSFFVWTVQFPVPLGYKLTNKSAFVHFKDDGSVDKIFYNVKQTSCLIRNASIPCADFSIDATGTIVTVIFETTTNGSGKFA